MIKTYPFSEQTLGHILEDRATACGDQTFLEFEDGSTVTFKACDEISNRVANGLLSLGLRKGDVLATFIPNSPESVYLWFGAAKAGIIDVPINLANKGTFLSHIINSSGAKAIVIDSRLIERLKFIENEVSGLKKVIVWPKTTDPKGLDLKFEISGLKALVEASLKRPKVHVKASDPFVIIYTSGTTGAAKGVLQVHTQIYLGASDYIEALRAVPDDVLFTCLPLFHGNARFLCIYPALLLGAKAVIYERFSASRFWDQIRRHKVTIFNSLGAIGNFLFGQPRKADDNDNPVRVCAAFPMPPQIYKEFETRYNLKVVEGYGLTETAIITYNPYDAPKIGSCGKETKTFEVRIVDENDYPVAPGTVGEIVARGKVPWAMTPGYVNMPDKTVELFRNHFCHTGDAGYMDEDGYVFFKDRIKDYIRRRGENISSSEIEDVVNSHPKVGSSAAIGVKSELSEDEVKIVVVLKEGEVLPPEELLAYCVDRMPYFAVPRYVEYVDALPRTANEKVQKAKLREVGITAATWDREKAGIKVER
ncbi:MAG: Long-chain-fatty-acid--CoA ligase [Syntrophorhabdaceae bacterium PtaU1.Bin034]|nr:MAG: Long-chain-fatty-acid--CoA ligase [Syntrophorhabdaceae bacterium PtaU1.Bin034]